MLPWKKTSGDSNRWTAECGVPGHLYTAVLRSESAIDGWTAHVFTGGALIHLSEHASRDRAARAAEAAIARAGRLRGLP